MVNLSENALTMADVAKRLGVHYELVRKLRDFGTEVGSDIVRLPFFRVGPKNYRTTLEAVERFIEQTNPESAFQQSPAVNAKARAAASRAMDNIRSKQSTR